MAILLLSALCLAHFRLQIFYQRHQLISKHQRSFLSAHQIPIAIGTAHLFSPRPLCLFCISVVKTVLGNSENKKPHTLWA
jgi:hypothetical protein